MNGYLLLILTGGTGIPLLVFAVARRLVESHADRTADAIRSDAIQAAIHRLNTDDVKEPAR